MSYAAAVWYCCARASRSDAAAAWIQEDQPQHPPPIPQPRRTRILKNNPVSGYEFTAASNIEDNVANKENRYEPQDQMSYQLGVGATGGVEKTRRR